MLIVFTHPLASSIIQISTVHQDFEQEPRFQDRNPGFKIGAEPEFKPVFKNPKVGF